MELLMASPVVWFEIMGKDGNKLFHLLSPQLPLESPTKAHYILANSFLPPLGG